VTVSKQAMIDRRYLSCVWSFMCGRLQISDID